MTLSCLNKVRISVWWREASDLTGEVPLQDQKASPKTLPSLTAAPGEPGNLQNAGSTEAASNQGKPLAPIQGTKPGLQAALGVAAWALPPGVVPAPCHSSNLRVKSSSGSRTEHFCQRPEASKKKKSVIPEQIPFLPGLSAPSDSLPTTTVPPLSQCPTSLHIKKKKKKKKVAYSLFLSFPYESLETGGNSNQINCTSKNKQTSNQGGCPPNKRPRPFQNMIKPGWKRGRETRNQQGWRDQRMNLRPRLRPTAAKFQILFQERAGLMRKKLKVLTFKAVRKRYCLDKMPSLPLVKDRRLGVEIRKAPTPTAHSWKPPRQRRRRAALPRLRGHQARVLGLLRGAGTGPLGKFAGTARGPTFRPE